MIEVKLTVSNMLNMISGIGFQTVVGFKWYNGERTSIILECGGF